MKTTINRNDFRKSFKDYDRDNFTYEGYQILFDFLEGLGDEGNEIELDVIGLCCDFIEYTEDEFINDYGLDNTFKNMNENLQDRVIGFTENTVILRA